MSRRGLVLVVLLAVVALVPWAAPAPAIAAATDSSTTSVTIISTGNDFVTRGQNYSYNAPADNVIVTLSATGSVVSVYVNLGTSDDWIMQFGATKNWQLNPGQPLQVGEYVHASNVTTSADEPYMSFGGQGRGENVIGDFRIREMTTDSNGHLTSLWLTFGFGNVFGDVRYQLPSDGGVSVAPADMQWPDSEPDTPPGTAQVVVRNPGSQPVEIGASSVTGAEAADYPIMSDGCAGQTLQAGQSCNVEVGHQPVAVGESDATLHVPEVGGPTQDVLLMGFVRSTHTEATLHSSTGDYIGQGSSYDFTPADGGFNVQPDSTPSFVQLYFGPGGWEGTFGSPDGPPLTPGTTYTNGFRVNGDGRGCDSYHGTFTVDELSFDAWGNVQSLAVNFTQYCDNSTAPLTGEIDFQADGVAVTVARRSGAARLRSANQLVVSGQVAKGRKGQAVRLLLQRKASGKYVTVVQRTLTLDGSSIYKTRIAEPRAGACRVLAKLPRTKAAVARQAVRNFKC